jgi:uroporphyrinogen-III synthase
MHVLITRPEPDGIKLKGLLEQRGHDATVVPFMSMIPIGLSVDALDGVTALLATSRNALRALVGSDALDIAKRLPVLTVGGATAEEARRLGFARVVKGPGTAADLVPLIASLLDPTEELLLHLAGERLAFDLASELGHQGFRVASEAVYRMQALARLPDDIAEAISETVFDAVIIMSPQTAKIWTRLVRAHKLDDAVHEISHICLSDAVAAALEPLGDVPIEVAARPSLEEVLALVDQAAAMSGG